MTTDRDRLLGTARGPYAWFLCLGVLGLAAFALVGWFRWGGAFYLVAAIGFAALAVAGMVRLRKLSASPNKGKVHKP